MTDLAPMFALIEAAPAVELPALIGQLETAKAAAWHRLTQPPALAPAVSIDADMTAADLARRYAVPKSLLYELARRGDIPHVRIGHYVRFNRAAVEQWMAEPAKTARLGIRKKSRDNAALRGPATALLPAQESARPRPPCQQAAGARRE